MCFCVYAVFLKSNLIYTFTYPEEGEWCKNTNGNGKHKIMYIQKLLDLQKITFLVLQNMTESKGDFPPPISKFHILDSISYLLAKH